MNIRIVLLDDGVESDVFNNVCPSQSYIVDKGVIQKCFPMSSAVSHGSCCAAVLSRFSKVQFELISIKVLDNTLKGSVFNLCAALSWCLHNYVHIIHMSCGTVELGGEEELSNLLDRLAVQGTLVIAAISNKNVWTVPASLSSVIGVQACPWLLQDQIIPAAENNCGIDLLACGTHELKTQGGKGITLPSANSFAAPVVTAVSSNLLSEFGTLSKQMVLDKIKNRLPYEKNKCKHIANFWNTSILRAKLASLSNLSIITLNSEEFQIYSNEIELLCDKQYQNGKKVVICSSEKSNCLCYYYKLKSRVNHALLLDIINCYMPDLIVFVDEDISALKQQLGWDHTSVTFMTLEQGIRYLN